MKITVLGSGGWGTALAILSNDCSHQTVIWGKFPKEIENIKKTGENPVFHRKIKTLECQRAIVYLGTWFFIQVKISQKI